MRSKILNYFLVGFVITNLLYFPISMIAQDLIVSTGESKTITDSSTYANVVVRNGGVLFVNGTLNVQGDLTVEDGGLITHDPNYLPGLTLKIGKTLMIAPQGKIDASNKGLSGSPRQPIFNGSGMLINVQMEHVGGSHGGIGGSLSGQMAYENLENPNLPGNGGGSGGNRNGCCSGKGGAGGGVIRIQVLGTLHCAGEILVNGQRGNWTDVNQGDVDAGGGAGGSIAIRAEKILGNGLIAAKGGSGVHAINAGIGGGGGGGRIAIYSDSLSPTLRLEAQGGEGPSPGSAGTIYIRGSVKNEQVLGRILINNNNLNSSAETPIITKLSTFLAIELRNYARVLVPAISIPENLKFIEPIVLRDACSFRTSGNFKLEINNQQGFDFQVLEKAKLIFGKDLIQGFDQIHMSGNSPQIIAGSTLKFFDAKHYEQNSGELLIQSIFELPHFDTSSIQRGRIFIDPAGKLVIKDQKLLIPSQLELVKDGILGESKDEIEQLFVWGKITHSPQRPEGLRLFVRQELKIFASGQIDASHKGYLELPNTNVQTGGSYGGIGGNASSNKAFGLIETPMLLGKGGGWGGNRNGCCGGIGGAGGGSILIESIEGSLTIEGKILAEGQAGNWTDPKLGDVDAGGGSGGSILIRTKKIAGTGLISVNGGEGVTAIFAGTGGGGGGGRIAAYCSEYDPLLRTQAYGGKGPIPGSAGSIFIKQSNKPNGDLLIDNGGRVAQAISPLLTLETSLQSLSIRNAGGLRISKCFSFPQESDFELSGNSTLIIDDSACLALPDFSPRNVQAGLIKIEETASLQLISNQLILGKGVSLIKDGKFNTKDSLDRLIVQKGGKLSTSSRLQRGLNLNVKNRIELQEGGIIDLDGKGLIGGRQGSAFGLSGETFVRADSIASGAKGINRFAGGAAYGGRGGVDTLSNPVYGNREMPIFLGSGGGAPKEIPTSLGGNGGGKLSLKTDTLILNGNIQANGQNGRDFGGGGSGGSVWIQCKHFVGNGSIKAEGGQSQCDVTGLGCSGAGGGGRIAIFTTLGLFPPENLSALPGAKGSPGTVGTIVYARESRLPEPDLWTEIGQRDYVRIGAPEVIQVTLGNRGDADAHDVVFLLKLRNWNACTLDSAQLRTYPWADPEMPLSSQSKDNFLVAPFWVSSIPAGEAKTFEFKVNSDVLLPGHSILETEVEYWINPESDFAAEGNFAFVDVSALNSILQLTAQNLKVEGQNESGKYANQLPSWLKTHAQDFEIIPLASITEASIRELIGLSLSDEQKTSLADSISVHIDEFFNEILLDEPVPPDSINQFVAEEEHLIEKSELTDALLNNCEPGLKPCDGPYRAPVQNAFDFEITADHDEVRDCEFDFSYRTHKGLDIAIKGEQNKRDPAGAWQTGNVPVLSMGAGVVSYVGEFGKKAKALTVCVTTKLCNNNQESQYNICYLHLAPTSSETMKKFIVGKTKIHQGDTLGYAGKTGADAIHIHVDLRKTLAKTAPKLDLECFLDDDQKLDKRKGIAHNFDECFGKKHKKTNKKSKKSEGVKSSDPNEKQGNIGAGTERYINGNEQLHYIIFFENVDSATASAQYVEVRDTLNKDLLDLPSFSFGQITFGNKVFLPVVDSNQYGFQSNVDLRPSQPILVKIVGKLDTLTGIANWTFHSLDPLTGKELTDPFLGFLPPNVSPPEGNGFVSFNIKPKDLEHRTLIQNRASIIFDRNPAILTNTWQNALDLVPPQSTVEQLPATQPNPSFQVKWSGKDEGSGIAYYDVYYAVNARDSFFLWLKHTPMTEAIFVGNQDSTYHFYVIATDSVGNQELKPFIEEASTTIKKTTAVYHRDWGQQFKVSPNPAHSLIQIRGKLEEEGLVILDILSITGQIVYVQKIPLPAGYWKQSIQVSHLVPGVYLLRLRKANDFYIQKIVISH